MPIVVGNALFVSSLASKKDWLTTGIGEAAVTFFILAVVWVIINEQMPKLNIVKK